LHVISLKKLRTLWEKHPEAEEPLRTWYKVLSRCQARNYTELKKTFNSADMVQGYTIFDVGGNKYRLIVQIVYEYGQAYIAEALTHGDYDTQTWKRRLGIKP
jgi:mRNA interferase HigB